MGISTKKQKWIMSILTIIGSVLILYSTNGIVLLAILLILIAAEIHHTLLHNKKQKPVIKDWKKEKKKYGNTEATWQKKKKNGEVFKKIIWTRGPSYIIYWYKNRCKLSYIITGGDVSGDREKSGNEYLGL